MPGFRKVPEPSYDRDVARLVNVYKKAFKETAIQLRPIKFEAEKQHAESLLNQIAFILQGLDADTKKWCEEVIPKAYKDGQYRAIVSIREANSLAEAASLASFSMLSRDTVEALVNDTYGDLLIATKNTERKIKQLVRSVVSDTMRLRAIEQLGRNTQRKEIARKLARFGLSKNLDSESWVGIVDSAGRRWNLSTYAEMVVRTKIQQAHVEGVRVEALERNVDLAVVSSHGATDSCRLFEGMVVSLNGTTPGYPTYAVLRATNKIFHPNCQHSVNPVRDLSLLPKDVREKAAESLKAAEQVLGKKYELPTPAPLPEPKPRRTRKPKEKPEPEVSTNKWVNQRTVKDAEKLASKMLPDIVWDFRGTHIDVMNPSMEKFVQLANEYPEVIKRLKYYGTYRNKDTRPRTFKWNPNTFAHAYTNGEVIGLNPKWYGDPDTFRAALKRCVDNGFHPPGSEDFASVVTHEFGHQVWNWLVTEYKDKALVQYVRSRGVGTGSDILAGWQRNNSSRSQALSISAYADTNAAETWAEGFTMFHHAPNVKNPVVENQKALLKFMKEADWYDKGEWNWLSSIPGDEREGLLLNLEAKEKKLIKILKEIGINDASI